MQPHSFKYCIIAQSASHRQSQAYSVLGCSPGMLDFLPLVVSKQALLCTQGCARQLSAHVLHGLTCIKPFVCSRC